MSATRFLSYLYEAHPADELAGWAKRLRYFRFCRAYGGHANDGDQLLLALRFTDAEDLLRLYHGLGIAARRAPADPPQPAPGVSYSYAEYQRFPVLIDTVPALLQPRHIQVAGSPVFAWVRPERLELSVADPGRPFEVTEEAVALAERVEAVVAPLADRVIDPPQDNSRCLCPKWHRYLFA